LQFPPFAHLYVSGLGRSLFFACLSTSASFAIATDWPTIIQQAVATDPRMLSAKSLVQARQEEVKGAYAVYLPVISGNGSLGDVKNDDPLVRQGNKQTIGLDIQQPLPLFGREKTQVALAKTAKYQEELELSLVQQQVTAEILEALLTLQSSQRKSLLFQQQLNVVQQQVRALEEAIAGGGAKLTDLRLLQMQTSQLKARVMQQQTEYLAAKMRVERLLPELQVPQLIQDDILRVWQTTLPQQMTELLTQQNDVLIIKKAQAHVQQAEQESALAKAELWPRFSINAQYQRGKFGEAPATSNSVFLGLEAPLYQGGQGQGRFKSANYRYDAAKETLSQEKKAYEQRVTEEWTQWQGLKQILTTWSESQTQAMENVKLVDIQMKEGAATILDMLKAQESVLETRLQGADYVLQERMAVVRLLQELNLLSNTTH
jgi:outer membrane protein TolC